ncbi:rod shape-determining protein MreC [Pseudobutyrivibrio sp. 49]|uniref:rod shape-determining protein MreC n=1 Tax=unclassified Pseudobutyrivibrio TaxID=2638619 RepID=UPI00088F87A2|nr:MULTISPECIES: rod shape-determining protein MreC [unclassified Pseudobutyrivibrio]SDH43290.1 rod shape-determining protein MreC [Pseudobutyrivibrio sp. 49]SFN44605.1 rod shape-determining protein MreC [Pseudobutyrivibrio sp. UC1225]
MRQRKANGGIPSKYLLTILSIICIMLLFFSYSTGFSGGPLETIANHIFIPMQKGIDYIGSTIAISSADTKTRKELVSENEALQAEVEELNSKISNMQLKLDELDELQKLYELDQSYYDYDTTGARIIGKSTSNWFNTFTIDKGTKDGIKVNMNVIADGGLVGIVSSVGDSYAVVRAIIDDTANVSATISSTEDNCIVSGSLEKMTLNNLITFSNLDDSADKVAIGDMVVTSNISDKYLPGILIGYVSEVNKDENDLSKSGTITPVVDFKHLSEVLVIKQLKESYKSE